MTEKYRPNGEEYDIAVEYIKNFGIKAKELGMELCYHNHDFDMATMNGKYLLDILYNDISSKHLNPQIDTCWITVGGENPAEYIKKYNGRIGIVHLKDFNGELKDMPENADLDRNSYENFGVCPVGYGVQDFKSILSACEEVNAEWVVVEQDFPAMDKTSLECAQMSIDYLKTLF